jgi:aminoglycoside 6'-N-acetyltransferase
VNAGRQARQLARVPDESTLHLRPLEATDAAELIRIRLTPEVRRWWGPPDAGFPMGDDPSATRWTVEIGGKVAGLVQYSEELESRYRHAALDIYLDPACHGQGYGAEVVRRTALYLIETRGHHRVTIDPAVENTAAIRAYEKAGFRPVGVMHAYERDAEGNGWHDGLLMELVADP